MTKSDIMLIINGKVALFINFACLNQAVKLGWS